uniref:Interleukin-1 receptor type 1-like n=1 Tax=Paramormyrops kingsleyae TaxID=1676925 RepID=A0A3B3Q2D9_9TELE|nr:interleukin-1 receptor type 1-like [Paramormyrops kingsleyae]XP_023687511.1 interleukin-1 receptor type 1-like [Paramormyrops kingsleyae]XP_023687512.1 interleukin-1 receptor type 1-like [Paramormyrops kingsleyae]XP_023687513.1 interleukin-1 receptor type 1-like [Paramormyrops kingsleyae]XP_023687514.1 interleukin-1 receptor type 1-like [Paramormyrops kingsleyae]XP_023687515.1 interleukin-1 receptor type 1-like [Paramormyrops kingsleyae]XP_023687516.1 interleukin-1 receptor type 1-like [Pa
MDLSFPMLLVAVSCLRNVCVAIDEDCVDLGVKVESVFTIPGEAAMLTCHLDKNVTDSDIISWHKSNPDGQLSVDNRWVQVQKNIIWLLRSTLQDSGTYMCILRTADQCFKQAMVLSVNETRPEDCSRPYRPTQPLTTVANGLLFCPLYSYMAHLTKYSFKWYKGCEPLLNGDKYSNVNRDMLVIKNVALSDAGNYTCRMAFTLAGSAGYISETISCEVKDQWNLRPMVSEPINDTIKANPGSSFSKTCRVFVPGHGDHMVDVVWALDHLISLNLSDRVNQIPLGKSRVENGEWLEVLLNFTEVEKEDFYNTYRCMVFNDKGLVVANFTLLPSEPNHLLSVGLFFGSPALIFIIAVAMWRIIKIEVALLFRSSFPCLYPDPGCDGKLYDAYVAYPRSCGGAVCGGQTCRAVEEFALRILPEVLEGELGYRLFIMGRESLPGEAVADVVQQNIGKSRRLLLLYSAFSLSHPDAAESLERQLAVHAALVESTVPAILVELGELVDSTVLPKAMQYLRSRQGAVRWGRSSEEGTMDRGRASDRFWKHLRYHMPPRISQTSPPEKNFLLKI